MQLDKLVSLIADNLKQYDSTKPVHKAFKPGIGPFGEPQIVREVARQLTRDGHPARTKRTPDLEIGDDWAIEFKIVRPFGDNGKEAENWSVNLLHPYPGNVSLIGDALKLLALTKYRHRGLIMLGYEHDPARVSLTPLIESFQTVATNVMNIPLGPPIEGRRGNLVHPEHQVLRCIGWPLI